MLTLLMGSCCRNYDLGRQCRAHVCGCAFLSRASAPVLALGDFAVSILLARFYDGPMGDTSGLAAPPRVVVQVSPGRTRLRMD
jgi:hypothetical protein